MRPTDELLSLPNVSWAAEAVELIFAVESRAMANHSVRSWAFARLLAGREGMAHEVDDALLFAATVLHDTGLRHDARAPVRFEVDGADYAAEFLTARQVAAGDVDRVWEAIALHTSPGIAERRGPLAYLVRAGIGIDFGRGADCVSDGQAAVIHEAYPRLSLASSIVDEIVAQCREVPERGPWYSLAGELTRERSTPPHLTRMEQAAPSSRWGAS